MIKSFFKTGIGIATTFMSITFLTSCSNSSLSTDIINGSDMSIKESILNLDIQLEISYMSYEENS